MTQYSSQETADWEFKIVRSATAKFKRASVVRQLIEEEARAGWELLEKFDDSRIRFKRRVEQRAGDANRELDPYRTHYGWSSEQLGLPLVAVLLGVAALAGLAIYLSAS